MADYDTIVRERQKQVRQLLKARHISIKAAYLIAEWDSPSTLLSYFPADAGAKPHVMLVASLFRLLKTEALPPDLLSLLLPDGFQIVRAPESIDHDAFAEIAGKYIAEKNRAHHPESENGRDIGPIENGRLVSLATEMGVAA